MSGSPPPEDPAREIRERALAMLARREHARGEIAAKLRARGHAPAEVETVLDGLVAARVLSDERFAEQFSRVHVERGDGPRKIRHALEGRGVEPALVDRALESAADDWPALARAARRKRFGAHAPATFADRARQSRFLERRGFTSDQIRAALGADPAED